MLLQILPFLEIQIQFRKGKLSSRQNACDSNDQLLQYPQPPPQISVTNQKFEIILRYFEACPFKNKSTPIVSLNSLLSGKSWKSFWMKSAIMSPCWDLLQFQLLVSMAEASFFHWDTSFLLSNHFWKLENFLFGMLLMSWILLFCKLQIF